MAETAVTEQGAKTAAEGAAKGEAAAKPAIGDTERIPVNGADLVKPREEILRAAGKQFAGEDLLKRHSDERKAWLEEQAQVVQDAKFAQSFKKAVTERDPKALREVLLGFGKFSDAEVDQSVNSWIAGRRENVAGAAEKGEQPSGEQVVGKIVEALQALDKRNKELVEQMAAMKKDYGVLDRRELVREDAEFDQELESAIKADDFHGEFAGGSESYLTRVKKLAKGILLRRVQNNQGPPDASAAKEALQEARAVVEDLGDGLRDDGIRGFALPSAHGVRDLHQTRKVPEPVAMTDAGWVENLGQRIQGWARDSAKETRESNKRRK